MYDKCRLCQFNEDLKESHIVPKQFYKAIKVNSTVKNTRIRSGLNPNIPLQDGLKLPFLCGVCEKKFSKYETFFSNKYTRNDCFEMGALLNTNFTELRYFILSMAWRVMQYDKEHGIKETINGGVTNEETRKSEEITEIWRNWLHNENHTEISNIQMHLIPLAETTISCDDGTYYASNGVAQLWRCYGEKDSYEYACVFIKTPKYLFLVTLWGNTLEMNDFAIGKTIEVRDYQLPDFVLGLLSELQSNFVKSTDKISQQQKEAIIST